MNISAIKRILGAMPHEIYIDPYSTTRQTGKLINIIFRSSSPTDEWLNGVVDKLSFYTDKKLIKIKVSQASQGGTYKRIVIKVLDV